MAFRTKAKSWVKKAVIRSGALSIAGRLGPPAAVILMYHSVVEEPALTWKTIRMSKARARFEAQMNAVARQFAPVTIEQVAQFARDGRQLPARAVAVTFDDGFADNYDVALPILNRYAVPATFYIMVDAIDTGRPPWYCRLNFAFSTTTKSEWSDPARGQHYKIDHPDGRTAALGRACDICASKTGTAQEKFVEQVEASLEVEPLGSQSGLMMTWDKVRALKRAGHIVGGHTLSHPNLAHVSAEEARSEIFGCKKRLEEQIGETVDHFSYPHPALDPQWSAQTLAITREARFKSAVLTTLGPVRRRDEPLGLKRVRPGDDLDQCIWNLEHAFLR